MPLHPSFRRRVTVTAVILLWLPLGILLASAIHGTLPDFSRNDPKLLLNSLFGLLASIPAGLPLGLAALFVYRRGFRAGLYIPLLPIALLTAWMALLAGLLGPPGQLVVGIVLSLPIWLIPIGTRGWKAADRLIARKWPSS